MAAPLVMRHFEPYIDFLVSSLGIDGPGRETQTVRRAWLLGSRGASFVVEAERIDRAVVRTDVDLSQRAPEAARRRKCCDRSAAVPQPLAGRAVVDVKHGESTPARWRRRHASGECEH